MVFYYIAGVKLDHYRHNHHKIPNINTIGLLLCVEYLVKNYIHKNYEILLSTYNK